MKKVSLLLFLAAFFVSINAQTTVNVATAGSLSTKGIPSNVTNLTITGKINAVDFKYIKSALTNLNTINIANVSIEAYTGLAGTKDSQSETIYPKDEIPVNAFANNTKLTNITLPTSATSIGENTFSSCSAISAIMIPANVTSIGTNAFADCTNIEAVDFSNSTKLLTIGNSAFSGCESITEIILPNSITNIGQSAFEFCSLLSSITLPQSLASIEDATFYSCGSLKSVTIPNGVSKIGVNAFFGCNNITTLNLGTTGATGADLSIENYAFKGCTNLKNIFINDRNHIPTATSTSFSGVPTGLSGCVLTILNGNKIDYETAVGWGNFIINTTTDIRTPDSKLIIYTCNDHIVINGIQIGQEIYLYSLNGELIQKAKATQNKIEIPVAKKGVYLVASSNLRIKIKI